MILTLFALLHGDTMNITLYKTVDSENVINKTLTDATSPITILLRRDTDLTYPEIILEKVAGIDFYDYNYAHISDIDKKYFISRIEVMSNDVFKLSLICDVLETYKTQVLATNFKYKRKLTSGDYSDVELDYTGKETSTEYDSDVEFTPSRNAVLSVMKWV